MQVSAVTETNAATPTTATLVALFQSGDDKFFTCQGPVESAKEIQFSELPTLFQRPGVEIVFWNANVTMSFLVKRGIQPPTKFHCAKTECDLFTGNSTRNMNLDHAYLYCVENAEAPTNSFQRAWCLTQLSSQSERIAYDIESDYLLKMDKLKKLFEPKAASSA